MSSSRRLKIHINVGKLLFGARKLALYIEFFLYYVLNIECPLFEVLLLSGREMNHLKEADVLHASSFFGFVKL